MNNILKLSLPSSFWQFEGNEPPSPESLTRGDSRRSSETTPLTHPRSHSHDKSKKLDQCSNLSKVFTGLIVLFALCTTIPIIIQRTVSYYEISYNENLFTSDDEFLGASSARESLDKEEIPLQRQDVVENDSQERIFVSLSHPELWITQFQATNRMADASGANDLLGRMSNGSSPKSKVEPPSKTTSNFDLNPNNSRQHKKMNQLRWGIVGPGRIAHDFTATLLVSGCKVTAVAAENYDNYDNGHLHNITSKTNDTSNEETSEGEEEEGEISKNKMHENERMLATTNPPTPLQRAQQFATKFSIPHSHAYDSYLQLANDPDVDIVYVATTNQNHLAPTMLMLQHNKNVLVEKPTTVRYEDTLLMYEEAKKRGLFLMTNHWTRFFPLVKLLRGRFLSSTVTKEYLDYERLVEGVNNAMDGNSPDVNVVGEEDDCKTRHLRHGMHMHDCCDKNSSRRIWNRGNDKHNGVRQSNSEVLNRVNLGKVLAMHGDFSFATPLNPTDRFLNKTLGGGVTLDVGCYLIELALLAAYDYRESHIDLLKKSPKETPTKSTKAARDESGPGADDYGADGSNFKNKTTEEMSDTTNDAVNAAKIKDVGDSEKNSSSTDNDMLPDQNRANTKLKPDAVSATGHGVYKKFEFPVDVESSFSLRWGGNDYGICGIQQGANCIGATSARKHANEKSTGNDSKNEFSMMATFQASFRRPSTFEVEYVFENGRIVLHRPGNCPNEMTIYQYQPFGPLLREIQVSFPLPPIKDELLKYGSPNYPRSEGFVYVIDAIERCMAEKGIPGRNDTIELSGKGCLELEENTIEEQLTTVDVTEDVLNAMGYF